MAKTFTFAVSQTPTKTPIVTNTWTKRIVLQEDASAGGFPSTDYLVYMPATTDLPIRIVNGSTFVIESSGSAGAPWPSNYTLGYISGVSNSTTFSQFEESTV